MIITLAQVIVFLLIFSRLVGVIAFAPFFSDRRIIFSIKIAFLFWLSGLLIFIVPVPPLVPEKFIIVFMAVIVEFAIGVAIGFAADLLLSGIEFAGGLMDTQAGLSVASLLDPSSGINAALFQQFLKWTVVILFLLVDGHHMILSAAVNSFTILPIANPVNIAEGAWFLVSLGKDIFQVAVILAAPILLVIFIVDFSFGILNRVAEQINVFQLGFQIKPTVALIIFLAITPSLIGAIMRLMNVVMENLMHLLGVLKV